MADGSDERQGKSAALRLAEEMRQRPLAAAALAGGAAAAAAAGYLGARAIARRNGACPERPLNEVLKTAITAVQCNGPAPLVPDTPEPDPNIGMTGD